MTFGDVMYDPNSISPDQAKRLVPTSFLRLTWRVVTWFRAPPPGTQSIKPDTFWLCFCSPVIRIRQIWIPNNDELRMLPTQRKWCIGFRFARILEVAT